MPTYSQYLYYASKQGFQPLSQSAFDSLCRACFNPLTNRYQGRTA